MAKNSAGITDSSENKVSEKKARKVKPYSENEALKRGQKHILKRIRNQN